MIKLSKSSIGEEEKKAVVKVLDGEYLGMGEKVASFENQLSNFFGRQVVAVSSGTAALQLALESCRFEAGSEVIVPSLTYVASFQAISAARLKPIACEVDDTFFTLDFNDAGKKLTAKTKAIMPVHYSGGVGNLDNIYKFADKHKLRVVEDAAHAFGTRYNDKVVGGFGDIACFSFDGIKNITAGEGGCIVSEDESIISRVKDSRLLSIHKDSDKRYKKLRSWNFDVYHQGWRYHMSDLMASIGIEQLKKAKVFFKKRQELAKLYNSLLEKHPRIHLIPHNYDHVVPHIYVVRIRNLDDRAGLQDFLLEKGIETGIHYQPNHLLSLYKSGKKDEFKKTEKIYSEILSLPLHVDLTKKNISYISDTLLASL
jgi:dTDP-4-amino-4,6-dideoxygalactose transaminase